MGRALGDLSTADRFFKHLFFRQNTGSLCKGTFQGRETYLLVLLFFEIEHTDSGAAFVEKRTGYELQRQQTGVS